MRKLTGAGILALAMSGYLALTILAGAFIAGIVLFAIGALSLGYYTLDACDVQ